VNPEALLGGQGGRFRQQHGLQGPLVVFLSAFAPDKGVLHVVEAMRHLWREGRAVELVLAGKTTRQFQEYWSHARLSAPEQRQVRVLGEIAEETKKDLLAAADILVMPSRTDSFGIIYLEAWLYGKPVIGAQAWGMGDVIDDQQDGQLVAFGDPLALSAAIADLLDQPEKRRQWGNRGREKVYRCYTWERCYPLIRDLYQRLVAASPALGA
jgi:glycosyltransferase involved in cell wall biosynthesis